MAGPSGRLCLQGWSCAVSSSWFNLDMSGEDTQVTASLLGPIVGPWITPFSISAVHNSQRLSAIACIQHLLRHSWLLLLFHRWIYPNLYKHLWNIDGSVKDCHILRKWPPTWHRHLPTCRIYIEQLYCNVAKSSLFVDHTIGSSGICMLPLFVVYVLPIFYLYVGPLQSWEFSDCREGFLYIAKEKKSLHELYIVAI